MATVLVVDDEFGISELLETILTDEGYRVLTAINGKHGIDVLAKERADLVITDYMMPVMDGAGLLGAMAADPTLRGIPVVVMSSMPEATVAQRCSGYVAFMRKPFKVAELTNVTARLLAADGGRPPDTVPASARV